MLSIGWTEMMVVAAIALIVVGPKDLPGMLRYVGKMAGSVRRMGNDFKNELNKVTAVDELKEIKNSITSPLTDTKRKIESEFNSIAPSGSVVPSGKIAPKDPNAESVVDEIKQAAGIKTTATKQAGNSSGEVAKAGMAASVAKAKTISAKKSDTNKKPDTKNPTTRKPAAKNPTAKNPTAKKPTAKKPTAKKTTLKKPVARKSTPRKQVAKKPVKSDS